MRSLQPTDCLPRPRPWSLGAHLAGWSGHLGRHLVGVVSGLMCRRPWKNSHSGPRTLGLSLHQGLGKARAGQSESSLSFGCLMACFSFVHIFICMESYEAYVVPTLLKFKSFGFIHVIPLFSLLKLDPSPFFSFPLLTLLNLSGVQRKSVQLSLLLLYCQPHPHALGRSVWNGPSPRPRILGTFSMSGVTTHGNTFPKVAQPSRTVGLGAEHD